MKKNKNRPRLESQEFLTPWNHDQNDTPSSSRLRIRHTDRVTLQQRNHSQPIEIGRGKNNSVSPKYHNIFHNKSQETKNYKSKQSNLKKTHTMFAKTMNITFRQIPKEMTQRIFTKEREEEMLFSTRSQSQTPKANTYRIHSNHPSGVGQPAKVEEEKVSKQAKNKIRKELIVTSYANFFPLSIKTHHTSRQAVKNDDRLAQVLRLLRSTAKKEGDSKIVKKSERNYFKKYLQGQRCYY